jgi:hypothetical protein
MNLRSPVALLPIIALAFACAAPLEPSPARALPAASAFLVTLGQAQPIGDLIVKPLAVVEDSRCPTGVQCIQAGTVRVQVKLRRGRKDEIVVAGLDSPVKLAGAWLHLLDACPYPRHPAHIKPGDYRFILAISPGPAFEGPRITCGA